MKTSTKIFTFFISAVAIVGIGFGAYKGISNAMQHHKNKVDFGVKYEKAKTVTLTDQQTLDILDDKKTVDTAVIYSNHGHRVSGDQVITYVNESKKRFGHKDLNFYASTIDSKKTYYYSKTSDVNSDDLSKRITHFTHYYLPQAKAWLPANITVINVTKPTLALGGRHVKATFEDKTAKITKTILFKYNQEDDEQSAYEKNAHGWFLGGAINIAHDIKGWMNNITNRVEKSIPFARPVLTFLRTRSMAQLIMKSVSAVTGFNLFVPIIPLYFISYEITKHMDTYSVDWSEDDTSGLKNPFE